MTWALLALLASCRARSASVAAPTPFTRETVLERLRAQYPGVTLPSDDLPAGVSAQEDLIYARADGHDLALDLYRPAGAGPHPAVILVHGGGWERGDRRAERPFAKRLAALGYVAAPVSYRLGAAGRFPGALFDLESAVAWLRAHATTYAIDPARVAAVGGSAGGMLVALLGVSAGVPALQAPRATGTAAGVAAADASVQAVVDIDGLADFTGPLLVAKEERNPGAPTRFLGGSFVSRPGIWRLASPITHVSARSAPTLFLDSTATSGASRADAPILPGRTEMRDRLRAFGVESSVVIFPDTPHPFWLVNPWFEGVLSQTDGFLRRQLRGIR